MPSMPSDDESTAHTIGPAMGKDKNNHLRSILGWRGLLAEEVPRTRALIFLLQIILSVTLTFTQLGFAGVELAGSNYFYLIVLLVPIAIVPLLLGTVAGTAFGCIAGSTLLLHAYIMPLNYYEFVLVTPATSIGLLTLCGFVQGVLYAWLLPRRSTLIKQTLLVGIACVVVSWMCSIGFAFYGAYLQNQGILDGVLADLILSADYALNTDSATAVRIALLGISTQAWMDAALMAIASETFYYAFVKLWEMRDGLQLRLLFGMWLFNAVAAVSMIVAVISFVSISIHLLGTAESDMRYEANYLSTQMGIWGQAPELESTPYAELLQGHAPDTDGIVFVLADDQVLMTNSTLFPKGARIDSLVDKDVLDTIEASTRDDEVKRFFLASALSGPNANAQESNAMQMAYMYAANANGHTIVLLMPAKLVFAERFGAMGEVFVGIVLMAVMVYALVFYLLGQVVGRHVNKTNEVLARITEGDLNARVSVDGAREFRKLSAGINTTVDALDGWIKEAETRMDSELAAARAIQEAALPRAFPPASATSPFDVFASMDPAKEVGGDFYDFFLIGNADEHAGKLGFMIADVSDKGVPAALFMMKAKALIHENMEDGAPLCEAVEHANVQLCEGNSSFMFVTAWIGVLDYGTRRVEYVNAGHNPPLLWRKDQGAWEWLEEASGPPLGIAELPYPSQMLACAADDALFLYTDGVSEAQSESVELYGEDRLEALLQGIDEPQAQELVETVRQDVARFAAGAEQSDDITMLALKIR